MNYVACASLFFFTHNLQKIESMKTKGIRVPWVTLENGGLNLL